MDEDSILDESDDYENSLEESGDSALVKETLPPSYEYIAER